MPWIDPDRTREAAEYLRTVARRADDLESDVRRSLVLSDLAPLQAMTRLQEVSEELLLLAAATTSRANAVEGFRVDLSPPWFASGARELLGSLLDDRGAQARIRGDLAIEIVLANQDVFVTDLERVDRPALFITKERLREVANDNSLAPDIRGAASAFVNNPTWMRQLRDDPLDVAIGTATRHLPSGAFTLDAIKLFRRRNEVITLLWHDAAAALRDPSTSRFTDEELQTAGVEPTELAALGLSRDHGKIVIAAINTGTFVHSPIEARRFIAALPIHAIDGVALNMFEIEHNQLRALHETAIGGLGTSQGDRFVSLDLIRHLPESPEGYRNKQITAAYASLANHYEHDVNGALAFRPESSGHAGANWFMFGTVASDTVGMAIDGTIAVFDVIPITNQVRQDIANGNQAIFSDFVVGARAEADGRRDEPTFLTEGFGLLAQASHQSDPVQRQELMLSSALAFAIHEQTIVDPYLSLPTMPWHQEVGTLGLTAVLGDMRTTTELMTDEGNIVIRSAAGKLLASPVSINEPMRPIDGANNLVANIDLCERFGEPLCSDRDVANDWSVFLERLGPTGDYMKFHLTDPAIFTAVASYGPLGLPPTTDDTAHRRAD